MILRRKIYDTLCTWKESSSRRTALMVEGPRRVGKSTIVEEFAKNEYGSYLLIDFNHLRPGTIEVFERYSYDIGLLTSTLAVLYGVELKRRDSLIVFDEVQHYPPARALIKYLVADGRYDYIETGSLISIKKNVRKIQIPSEEEHIDMHPMDFEEFLWADGDTATYGYIRRCFDEGEPLGPVLHAMVLEKYKTYMMVGGMPQAVVAYIEHHDLQAAESVKREILRLYTDDFRKIESESGEKARAIFKLVPAMLSSRKKVFRPGLIRDTSSTDEHLSGIDWLEDSKICNVCRSITDPSPAINLSIDVESLKFYLCDTGLLLTMAFDDGTAASQEVMEAFIKGKLSINEGMFFENMVAQGMVSAGHKLHFMEFYMKNDRRHLYEVDFVLVHGKKIVPVEVKSGQSDKHRSLDLLMEKYPQRVERAYVVHPRDLRIDGNVTYVPVYMSELIR